MSIWKEVEVACEEFRTRLVELVGDHAGVHNAVNDARASLAVHVPIPSRGEGNRPAGAAELATAKGPEPSVTTEEEPPQAE